MRELVGAEITEHALISSALNIGDAARAAATPGDRRMNGDWRYRAARAPRHAARVRASSSSCSRSTPPTIRSASTPTSLTTAANKGVLLALVAMAQTILVLTAGIDLSVGMVFVLANCLASAIVVGTPRDDRARRPRRARRRRCSAARSTALIVVYGRLQPIIATLATGAIFYGVALALRRVPGGDVNADLADALTGQLPSAASRRAWSSCSRVVLLVWLPFRRSVIGRAAYAVGSSEQAAYMSGVPIGRAKFVAYTAVGPARVDRRAVAHLHHLFGRGLGRHGGTYTLNSIAAVVIGGTSLFGGSGSAIGAIFGAFMFRTIGDCSSSSISTRSGSRCSRASCCWRRSPSARCGCCASATGSISIG